MHCFYYFVDILWFCILYNFTYFLIESMQINYFNFEIYKNEIKNFKEIYILYKLKTLTINVINFDHMSSLRPLT